VAAVRSFLRDALLQDLGVAIAQATPITTPVNLTSVPYCGKLLATMDLDGVLVQADALHYPETVFSAAHGAGGPTFLPHSESKPKGPCIARSASSSSTPQRSLSQQLVLNRKPWTRHHLDTRPNRLTDVHNEAWPGSSWIVELVFMASVMASPPSSGTFFLTSLAPRQKPLLAKTGEGPLVALKLALDPRYPAPWKMNHRYGGPGAAVLPR